MKSSSTRRDFLLNSIMAGAAVCMSPLLQYCSGTSAVSPLRKKMVILGIDGMDPVLLSRFMDQGVMPNFEKLGRMGSYQRIKTSIPPQSPVAWSEFAVGAPADVHGIFDFIHRDPRTMQPYFSTSHVAGPSKTLKAGRWEIPVNRGRALNLREGKPFWAYLGEAGIATTIFKMPGDFPASCETGRCVSGMGTPDLTGSYGQFTFFTSNPDDYENEIAGGTIVPVDIVDHKITTALTGPVNVFKASRPHTTIPLAIFRDAEHHVARVALQNHTLLLKRGEWSDWLPLSFEMVPRLNSVQGICRVLIKQVHPHFEMYVSPVHIDPTAQSLPVTKPQSYGRELARHIGLFGTKGLPADTSALSSGILNDVEYLQASHQIYIESRLALCYELDRLSAMRNGLLFFYFSNIDQDSHMFWPPSGETHERPPQADAGGEETVIRQQYMKMDAALEEVYSRFDLDDPDFRLIIMSDHGFAPFGRCVNLNTWLLERGYVRLIDADGQGEHPYFENVDWSETQAYGLGINAIYVNQKGREKDGIVPLDRKQELLRSIRSELLALRDPATGEQAVSNVWLVEDLYHRQDDVTPDLIVGWNRGYRASWDTVLGGFPLEVFEDNNDKWQGDHCIDPSFVPGVLLANKSININPASLVDVTATVMAEFQIPLPKIMTGRVLYEV